MTCSFRRAGFARRIGLSVLDFFSIAGIPETFPPYGHLEWRRGLLTGRTSRKERGHARDDGLGGGLGDCRTDGARRTRCSRANHPSATDSTAASDTISGASFDHRTYPTAGPDWASPASRVRCAARRGNNGQPWRDRARPAQNLSRVLGQYSDPHMAYRDTTAWLRTQSSTNPSPHPNSLLTGKLTGNFGESNSRLPF